MASRGNKGLMVFVRVAVGLLVLAFVAYKVPWRDQLVWQAGDVSVTVPGTIEGDWKAEAIRFLPDRGTPAPAEWPESARRSWSEGRSLPLSREDTVFGGGRVKWEPGMPRAFSGMDSGPFVKAVLLFLFSFLIVVTRWWRLLAVAGCVTSWFNALRLTFLGMFFNLVMPGLTGGDVIKAVIVARENPERRADALVSVVVDRMLGMASLATVAAVVIVAVGSGFAELRVWVLGLLALGLVGLAVYASPAVRRRLPLTRLVDRLPLGDKLRKLDRAALTYLRHPLELSIAVALSLFNHVVIIVGVLHLGRAIGVDPAAVGLADYFIVVPVANIVSAVPVLPGGWGVGEAMYGGLFKTIGADPTLGVAVSILFRLTQLGFGLVGGLFLLVPGAQAAVREAEASVGES